MLIADDEETVRKLLQRMIENAGYTTLTAANGKEALERIAQEETGILVLDIKMPEMSGIEVLKRVAADYPDICVVMATAVADTRTAVETMRLGADDYITKPFRQEDVLQALKRAAGKRDRRLEEERQRQQLEETISKQAEQLQQQFVDLVETLAREHKLLYEQAAKQRGGIKSMFSKLPPELRKPMSSVEEYSEALLKILRRTK